VIEVEGLRKTFVVHRKEPGLLGSLKSLVRRRHVEKVAVRGVSFRVEEGEILGLVGPNGAGKTTVVKMLAGVVHPSGGDARVLGHRPWERADAFRRQIALIMGQKAQLWWDLPAADGFLLLRDIYEVPEADHRRRLGELAEALGVARELEIPVRRLSLGERMKMELIAALLHAPRVVFLDEPTIGLDLASQRAIRDFLLRYRREHRPAMLLTSHYMEDIERLCERILILQEGEILYDGSLAQVLADHATHKVVIAHLRRLEAPPEPSGLADLGEVLEATSVTLRLRVPRARVAESASALLRRLPVADLTIQEEDIGEVIEGILRRRAARALGP
jgi:ABC-2 type transport system ATP-binding protein